MQRQFKKKINKEKREKSTPKVKKRITERKKNKF